MCGHDQGDCSSQSTEVNVCARPVARGLRRCRAGLLLIASLLVGSAAAAPSGEDDPHAIDCARTPFGLSTPMVRHAEPLFLLRSDNGQSVDEYRMPIDGEVDPIVRVQRSPLIQGDLPDKPWQTSVTADLEGDGRDELVVAFSDSSFVQLAVYRRAAGLEPSLELIDTWRYEEAIVAGSIDLRAGDFDGSKDGKQELALSWQRSAGGTRVTFLTGDLEGGIAQSNGGAAGTWLAPLSSGIRPRLAIGDFLLDGRDQVILVGTSTDSSQKTLTLDLVEFATANSAALPPSSGSSGGVGSKHFENDLLLTPLDDLLGDPWVGWPAPRTLRAIVTLGADGGDMAGDTQAELLVHMLLQATEKMDIPPTPVTYTHSRTLVQRVFHFDITRDDGGALLAIDLGNGGKEDDSRIVSRYRPLIGQDVTEDDVRLSPEFDAALLDVDGAPPFELVTLEAGRPTGFVDPLDPRGPMRWWAYRAHVRLVAAFGYQNLGQPPGGNSSSRSFRFHDTSRGDAILYEWSFGDGATSTEANPIHTFTSAHGSYPVTLTITDRNGDSSTYQSTVALNGNPSFSYEPKPTYAITTLPVYKGEDSRYSFSANRAAMPSIAAADIDNDGKPEVLTVARNTAGDVFRYVWRLADVDTGAFTAEVVGEQTFGVQALQLLTGDIIGDSIRGTLGGDCRRVTDNLVRTLTWMPPYFLSLQASVYKIASFGRSTSSGSSFEQRAGTYFSHDVSGYVGVSQEISVFGLTVAEWSVKATAGHNWQSERGTSTGQDTDYTVNDGSYQNQGEALVELESYDSECYSYDVRRSSEIVPDSALRMCEVLPKTRSRAGSDADTWNSLSNQVRPVKVPLHWTPLQRDWASFTLFQPVATSEDIPFQTNGGADKATDGLFSTSAESTQATSEPYLEIDLGQVRDIGIIRVFPTTGHGKQLSGFRLYASETPFGGPDAPSGSQVREFRQDTGGTETSYQTWNLWTRDPANTAQMLRARYLRLQHPGPALAELHVAEIQAFGDTHAEPAVYPDAVCDPAAGDGLFLVSVWDQLGGAYRTIEARGDLIWSGASDTGGNTGVKLSDGSTCRNGMEGNGDRTIAEYGIWSDKAIGDSSQNTWSLDSSETRTSGNYTSMDSATRVGAEFEAKVGIGTSIITGAGYEFTYGAVGEKQSSLSWGSGLAIGGEIGGFVDPAPGVVELCQYYPRPYAFNLREYSNVGFAQDVYVTDYVVRQSTRAGAWQRRAVPAACYGGDPDLIFANGFDD